MPVHSVPERNNSSFPHIDLRPTVRPTALIECSRRAVMITGTIRESRCAQVLVRVTTGQGQTSAARVSVRDNAFRCAYPADFPGAPPLIPTVLFVDATTSAHFDTAQGHEQRAEITLLLYDRRRHLVPDYPSAFTTNLLDRRGRRDQDAAEWPAMRALVNLYQRSRGARLAQGGKTDFDLARPADRAFFQNNLALYDFDHRDRDWSRPLKNRPGRTFWQSVWNTWFNKSNDHPWDGNPANTAASNYVPYAFTNDFADILIQHTMRRRLHGSVEDDLETMCREATENLLACQHREASNFAVTDARGKRETYTAGAFRYGLFENGEFLVEGKGWFANPDFRDYADGGVLNGRAIWAIGEALRAEPGKALAAKLRAALVLGVQFCLQDALAHGYAKRTAARNVYWRDAGEHAYLTIGMLAACAVAPELIVLRPAGNTADGIADGKAPRTLRAVCASALDALVDLQQAQYQWAVYPNVDSMAIVALADGALTLRHDFPRQAARWRKAAQNAAHAWIKARVDSSEFSGKPVHFGLRLAPDTMTYRWSQLAPDAWKPVNVFFFYQTGHWIHALSRLYRLTGETAYRQRAEAMIAYLCGDNPWGVRLLNELGGVYNWVEDRDGDGIEDHLKQDMYPESTAFCQIGIFHLLNTLADRRV